MRAISSSLFRYGLLGFPSDFRRAFADEMLAVFSERCAGKTGLAKVDFTLLEVIDAFMAGIRMRFAAAAFPHPALAASVVVAIIATTFAIHDATPLPESRIHFSAHDPAGTFTITILNGKPIAATINQIPLPARRIVQEADSIRILASNGEVALAVAFDRATSSIAWKPRAR